MYNFSGGNITFGTSTIPGAVNDIVTITDSGRVGIGTDSPTQRLEVIGNICATGGLVSCSDIRFKKDITQLTGALARLRTLRGVKYYWNTDKYPEKDFVKDKQIGLIA